MNYTIREERLAPETYIGFLRRSDDAAGFAQAIQTLKNDPALARRCGEANREAVRAYLLEPVQQEILELLRSI